MRVVFVHGACVRDGDWWWHLTAEELRKRGIESVAPELPSCVGGGGLSEDAAAVRAVLDEPAVVVAHSYGGIVAAEAATSAIQHLVLVSSYLPEPGESLSTFGAATPPPFLDFDPVGGTFGVRPELFAPTFMQDCPPEIVSAGAGRLIRQNIAVLGQPVTATARHYPSTYVVCADDRGTPAERQREFAERADKVVEIGAGHHPFLSRPAAMADIVAAL